MRTGDFLFFKYADSLLIFLAACESLLVNIIQTACVAVVLQIGKLYLLCDRVILYTPHIIKIRLVLVVCHQGDRFKNLIRKPFFFQII